MGENLIFYYLNVITFNVYTINSKKTFKKRVQIFRPGLFF